MVTLNVASGVLKLSGNGGKGFACFMHSMAARRRVWLMEDESSDILIIFNCPSDESVKERFTFPWLIEAGKKL